MSCTNLHCPKAWVVRPPCFRFGFQGFTGWLSTDTWDFQNYRCGCHPDEYEFGGIVGFSADD